ncbi:ArsR/SmtB family transcription factor [Marimonas lutisalis]|uniref:ArsR/SmtB family transcription factor n=1 Tax=Marimonas lutisalis TaxID=2545756 RepID=UPI0010F561DC|nr:winged helix-turn-helix domain-containing protein [Marimonas lutisalis]
MKEGPDISRIGAMLGDPARANILTALMSGKALTAGELAYEAGITPATASGHLRKLEESGLILPRKQGRHRYFTLAGDEVAHALETLMGLAAERGHLRSRIGPRDPDLRAARVCYDHMAGTAGVRIFDSLLGRGLLELGGTGVSLTGPGRAWATAFGIDLAPLESARRPLCRTCLDWSERRTHLAGSLGAAILANLQARRWAQRLQNSRVISFSDDGRAGFETHFPLAN